jgi:hypothetical protein
VIRGLTLAKCTRKKLHNDVIRGVKLYRVHIARVKPLITSLWSCIEYTSPGSNLLSHHCEVVSSTHRQGQTSYYTSLWCDKRFDPGDVYSIQLHNNVIRGLSVAKCTRCNFTMMWEEVWHLRCVLDTNSLCCDKNFVRGEVYSIQLHNDVIRILCDAKWTRCNFTMMWYEVCPWRSVLDAISLWCDTKFVRGEVYLIQDHYDVIRSLAVPFSCSVVFCSSDIPHY